MTVQQHKQDCWSRGLESWFTGLKELNCLNLFKCRVQTKHYLKFKRWIHRKQLFTDKLQTSARKAYMDISKTLNFQAWVFRVAALVRLGSNLKHLHFWQLVARVIRNQSSQQQGLFRGNGPNRIQNMLLCWYLRNCQPLAMLRRHAHGACCFCSPSTSRHCSSNSAVTPALTQLHIKQNKVLKYICRFQYLFVV